MIDKDSADVPGGTNLRMLGGLVRLSFHDCVGAMCDGCINNNNVENAGRCGRRSPNSSSKNFEFLFVSNLFR